MRRLIALVLIAAIVVAAVFLADHPGRVEIVWYGWQVDTSAAVLGIAFVACLLALWGVAELVTGLLRLPSKLRRRRAARRRAAGDMAVTRGLVALAAGDAVGAQREAERAAALLGGAPLPLLLAAEAAQQQGDTVAARGSFARLLERPESEFLGLRGLLGEALRTGDGLAARSFATRAHQLRPAAPWLTESLLALQARAGDWPAALETIADAARHRVLPAERARHHRGAVLYEQAREAERQGDLRRAAALAARAQALVTDIAAPAALHARLLLALGRTRPARKAVERAWRSAPHADLARVYLDIHAAAGPLAQAAALQHLAEQNPDAPESHLAVAEAAMAAQLWGEARRHLGSAVAAAPPPGPTRRLCRLMARLEDSEPGHAEAARGWLERAAGAPLDPCYVCTRCHAENAEWQALCRQCGGFDTLTWRIPERGAVATAGEGAASAPLLMLPAPPLPVAAAPPSGLAARLQYDK
jgi:HemY protein